MRDSLLPDAGVFMFEDAAPDLFDALKAEIDWQQSKSFVYGQWYDQPRLTAYYGESSYDYSGVQYRPEQFLKSNALMKAKACVEQLCDVTFNACVCNLYRDGQDSIGWHSDNEPELGNEPVIASLSFGADRKMAFRRVPDSGKKERHDLILRDRSALVMLGDTQQNWQHSIPKTTKVLEPRINLTFRQMK